MSASNLPKVRDTVWVLGQNDRQEPELMAVEVPSAYNVPQQRELNKRMALRAAKELGIFNGMAVDSSDPAGRVLQEMRDMQSLQRQRFIPGPSTDEEPEARIYSVPVTVDMSLSARIIVRGEDKDEAIRLARTHASENFGLFSLDDGNYRGAADFYCPDPDDVYQPEATELALATAPDTGGKPPACVALTIDQVDSLKQALAQEDAAAAQADSGVVKTVVVMTVLHSKDEDLSKLSAVQIASEIEEGDMLGQLSIQSVQAVPRSQLVEEQLALGNDGSFFDHVTDDDGDDDPGELQPAPRGG